MTSDHEARKEMVEKTGRATVPVIDIDGDIAIGYEEDWLRKKLGLTKPEPRK